MKNLFIISLLVFSLANNNSFSQNDTLSKSVGPADMSEVNPNITFKIDQAVDDWQLKTINALSELHSDHTNKLLINKEYPDSVYISRLNSIPSVVNLTYNKIVKAYIKVYMEKKRASSERILGLSEYYFPIFEPMLDKYDLPYELKYMAIIESALISKARSRVGASGLWQFMFYTGKAYGLKINSYIDERYDPVKATEAACQYLVDMYSIYHDWTLVIAAYNCGAGNVNKAIRRSGKRNYWDIYYYLPRETRGYIPSFIAATYMMNFYQYHGLTPRKLEMPLATDTIQINTNIHFNQLSKVLDVPKSTLVRLNPQYLRKVVFGADYTKILKLPVGLVAKYEVLKDSIYAYNRAEYFSNKSLSPKYNSRKVSIPKNYAVLYYKIKKGDNLGYIADWYDTWVSRIKHWNRIRNSRNLKIGKVLKIYVPKSKKSYYALINKKSLAWKQKNRRNVKSTELITLNDNKKYKYYRVRPGDTMWDISKKHGVSVSRIKKLNNIKRHRTIKPGQLLIIKKT